MRYSHIADEEKPVEICLDVPVEKEYKAGMISGNPEDKNSLEHPCVVTEHWEDLTGADSNITYTAPAYSVNVLRLGVK